MKPTFSTYPWFAETYSARIYSSDLVSNFNYNGQVLDTTAGGKLQFGGS